MNQKAVILLVLLGVIGFARADEPDGETSPVVEVVNPSSGSDPMQDVNDPAPEAPAAPGDEASTPPASSAPAPSLPGADDAESGEDVTAPGEPAKPKTPRIDPQLRSYYLRGSKLGSPSGPNTLKKPKQSKRSGSWKSEVELGATGYRGNNDSELLLVRAKTERKKDEETIRLGVRASVGNKDGERDRENGEAEAAYRDVIRDRWYYTAEIRYFTDAIADVDYQFVSVLSPGYDAIKTDTAHLALEVGPAYIAEKKGGEEKNFAAARIAVMMDKLIDERVLVWERFEYLPALEDTGVYLILAEVGVETALTDWFRLRTVLQQRYDSTPAEDKDKQDLFLSASLVAVF
ncbi:MAG TPA: DUF481 domain-containing protein [Kiritimatiellia bacterium]|nr:DUF481 domain-containing protein [Kiritimatiellia bacterium]HMP32789.1 DUF481 domain-containing protein [Kiritimatiellia bacterium]